MGLGAHPINPATPALGLIAFLPLRRWKQDEPLEASLGFAQAQRRSVGGLGEMGVESLAIGATSPERGPYRPYSYPYRRYASPYLRYASPYLRYA